MDIEPEIKNKLEAVLFTIGRFIDTEELARICNIGSAGIVKEALMQIKHDYSSRNTALELIEEDNKWRLNIKGQYGSITNKILANAELDSPTMKTLAMIAYKQPVQQSLIIKIRGNSAYDHIKQLKEQNFITSEAAGRTRILKLTKTFYEYFDINKDEIKAKLQSIDIQKTLDNVQQENAQ